MSHLISIIMPTYNSANHIRGALDSILNQTFADFEILIIDGLSSDETVTIAKSFNDKRIRIFSERDKGIYDAMNKGIKNVHGDWVYFLGSDDRLYSNTVLQELAPYFIEEKIDVIYGDVHSSRFNGRYDGEFDKEKIKDKNICHQAIFFRKKIFKTTGLFDLKYPTHADWDHNLKWFLNSKIKRKFVDIIVAEYADGGFSSCISDTMFSIEKKWNSVLYNKKNMTFFQKIHCLTRELNGCIKLRQKRQFLNILYTSYRLFI